MKGVLQFVDNNVTVQVSCAVRSYWSETPELRTDFVESLVDYFVGIKYSSVITFCPSEDIFSLMRWATSRQLYSTRKIKQILCLAVDRYGLYTPFHNLEPVLQLMLRNL